MPFAYHTHAHAGMPPGLRELDVGLFIDALLDVLCDRVATRGRAALDGINVFVRRGGGIWLSGFMELA
jgi:hypothetical protein